MKSKKTLDLIAAIEAEIDRQDIAWGDQSYVPDDRWLEICTDEFNDLRWAVRCPMVVKEDHDIPHELIQTIATLARWYRGRKEESGNG